MQKLNVVVLQCVVVVELLSLNGRSKVSADVFALISQWFAHYWFMFMHISCHHLTVVRHHHVTIKWQYDLPYHTLSAIVVVRCWNIIISAWNEIFHCQIILFQQVVPSWNEIKLFHGMGGAHAWPCALSRWHLHNFRHVQLLWNYFSEAAEILFQHGTSA